MSGESNNNHYDIKLAEKYQKIRKRFIYKVANKDITFKQFCLMAQSEEYKTLRGIKISRIMDSFSSWTTFSIQHAFIAYNIPINITVGQVMRNKNYFNIVSALMDSSSSSWQKRIKAPEGFPWNGNIIKALSELNDIELPRELETAVRYYPTQNDNNNTVDDYEDFKNESSQYMKDDKNDDYVENSDDDLDILLADEEDEENNDGLDSFLSNDDDYNENSVQVNEDNDDSNGGKRNIQDELNNILNSEDNEEKDSFDKLFDEDEDDGYLNLF